MSVAYDEERSELMAVWSTVTTLRQLPTPDARRDHLVEQFEARPWLAKYFRAAYDRSRDHIFSSKDVHELDALFTKKLRDDDMWSPLKILNRALRTDRADQGAVEALKMHWSWLMIRLSAHKEIAELVNRILDHNLVCGITRSCLNRAFAIHDMDCIEARAFADEPLATTAVGALANQAKRGARSTTGTTMVVLVGHRADGVVFGAISDANGKLLNWHAAYGEPLRRFLAGCRELGMEVKVDEHNTDSIPE